MTTPDDPPADIDLRSDSRSRTIDAPVDHVSGNTSSSRSHSKPAARRPVVRWRQTFDTAEHDREIVAVISAANEQNLERLAAEVQRGESA